MSDRRYTYFWKKTHCSFVSRWMGGLVLWLFILTACVGEELQKPLLGEGEGYLTLQVDAISAEVTSDPLTKATLENLPAQADFAITIKDASGSVMNQFDKLSEIKNPLVLKAGVKYTVEAYHGTNEALQDTPYFFGNEKVTIQANTNNQLTVNASLANAMIIPVVTDSLKNHYKSDWTLTASVGETSLLLASAEAGIDTLYAHADSIVSLTFTGTNKADQNVSFKWTATEAVKASKAYTVQCKPDLAAFKNIQVTATATHTKDSNGDLNGTDVTFNANINDKYKAAIDSFKVQVFNSNQQIIRTYTGTSLSNMKCENNDWPYIPQGSSLSASVKLKAGDEISLTNASIDVPKPEFGVEVTGTTSYDLYLAENISEANGMDAETIKGIGATAKISDALLSNSNYSHSFTLTYDDEEHSSGTSTINVGDKTNQSWGNHPITATMVFDGQSIEAKKDCHITGLPYSAAPPTKDGGWHCDQNNSGVFATVSVSWEQSYVRLAGISESPIIQSPQFYIPDDDINIYMSVNIGIHNEKKGVWYLTDFKATVNNKSIIQTGEKKNGSTPYTVAESHQMSKTGNIISLQSTRTITKNTSYVNVYKVEVKYNR